MTFELIQISQITRTQQIGQLCHDGADKVRTTDPY